MKVRRLFVEGKPLGPGERVVTGKRAGYLTRVLRLGVGDTVILFDGGGKEFPAEIVEARRQSVLFKVAEGAKVDRESDLNLVLALGLPRPAIMDLIVQKVTELGVHEIVPVSTERTQEWLTGEKGVSRQKRWDRIAQEAARQSGRNRVPRISPLTSFNQVLEQRKDTGLKVICWEGEESGSLRQTLAAKTGSSRCCVLIGPEGGFSITEVGQAVAAGFQSISLGRRILRTETAAIMVIGLIQYELGDLGLWP